MFVDMSLCSQGRVIRGAHNACAPLHPNRGVVTPFQAFRKGRYSQPVEIGCSGKPCRPILRGGP